MADERRYTEKEWHLDKRVPIALIMALVLQTTSIIWWAANLDNRVAQNEKVLTDFTEYRDRVLKVEIYQENILNELRGLRSDLSVLLTEKRRSDSERQERWYRKDGN